MKVRIMVRYGGRLGLASLLALGLQWHCVLTESAFGQSNHTDAWLWMPRGTVAAPAARTGANAIWTGSRMLIWGGQRSGNYSWVTNGYCYDVLHDSWSPMSLSNSPTSRYMHTAIWTGREMIIWGGHNAAGSGGYPFGYNTGARYDPVSNIWHSITTVGAPCPREQHTAVWTGKEMIVWGGLGGDNSYDVLNDGGRCDPSTDTWKQLSTVGAPTARTSQVAVWTGEEMIVWGGNYLTLSGTYEFKLVYPADMGRYNPTTDSWITTTPVGFPTLRADCSAIWDGSEIIVWGGYRGNTYGARICLDTGGRFNPLDSNWTDVSTSEAPSARDQHVAVWTGSQMIVWGGTDSTKALRSGGRYHPATDTWSVGSTNGAPTSSFADQAVWTGEAMLVYNSGLTAYYEPGIYAWDDLPNDWQRRYFGDDNPQATPLADPDGDSQNNQQEFIAGTIPTNAASRLDFSITTSPSPAGRLNLNYRPCAGARVYSLLAGTNLSVGDLLPVAVAITNNPADFGSFTVTNTTQPWQYFRLEIRLP